MKPLKIVLFNGPPRAGKDTGGDLLRSLIPAIPKKMEKFAIPHVITACGMLRITHEEWLEFEKNDPQFKEHPRKEFNGRSIRNFMQDFSEKFMKPLYGEDVFGKLLVSRIEHYQRQDPDLSVIIVTDAGFNIEAEVVFKEFNPDNVIGVRVHRKDCSFDGDTRETIQFEKFGCPYIFDIDNNYGFDAYREELKHVVLEIVET